MPIRLHTALFTVFVFALLTGCGKKEAVETAPPEPPPKVAEAPPEPEKPLKDRAEAGDPEACYQYGLEFEAAGDQETAFSWFKRAAKESHPAATYVVGTYYAEGIACERDPDKARRCFVIASKADHPEAKQALLALVTEREKEVKRERVLQDEEFEGMSISEALPLVQTKAAREATEWQQSDEFKAMMEAEKARLFEEYAVDPKFINYNEYQPLSLLKRQVAVALEEADVSAQADAAFDEARLAAAQALAAKEVPSFAVGENITIQTRRGPVSGTLQKMDNVELRVGSTTILLDDVPREERRKLDPDFVKKGRDRILQREFHGPRATFIDDATSSIEDDVMLEAGYLYYNGTWVTTDMLYTRLIVPRLNQYSDEITRNKASESYRAILERNGFAIVGDQVVTVEQKQALIAQHTEGVSQSLARIAEMLKAANSPEDFNKAINYATQAINGYPLATNRADLMQARIALAKGKAKLTGVVELPPSAAPSPSASPAGNVDKRRNTRNKFKAGRLGR